MPSRSKMLKLSLWSLLLNEDLCSAAPVGTQSTTFWHILQGTRGCYLVSLQTVRANKSKHGSLFLRMKWNTHQPERPAHWKIPVLSRLTNKSSSYVNRARDASYLFICLKGKATCLQVACQVHVKQWGEEKSTTKEFKDKILRTPNWVKIAFWQISPIANETEIQVIL